jgi:succinoglycan biosynthesis protein ExoA
MTHPTITVIIPRKAEDSAEAAIRAVQQSEYPPDRLEILEVVGASPSKQRNTAAAAAHGDILYFLDNDSLVTPTLFSRIANHYLDAIQRPRHDAPPGPLAGVGGPNLTPPTDSWLQRSFGHALASPFGLFTMRARYIPTGRLRCAGEKELILCNLSIRRDSFLAEGGFDESLYPNEENEFINRLTAKGCRFLYDPKASVYRSQRSRFGAFIKQFFRYGRGRADQFLLEGLTWRSLVFFLPAGLCVYLLLLVILGVVGGLTRWMGLPLLVYGGLALGAALHAAFQACSFALALVLPVWFLVMHLAYGIGFVGGLLRRWRPLTAPAADQTGTEIRVIVRKALGSGERRKYLRPGGTPAPGRTNSRTNSNPTDDED